MAPAGGQPPETGAESISRRPSAVAAWLASEGLSVTGLVDIHRVGIGQSNVTSTVTDECGESWILREPPPEAIDGAHDMRREMLMLDALGPTSIPVPTVVARGEYADGRAFYAMTRAVGTVLESEADAAALPAAERETIGEDVVVTLAALHSIDPAEVGLQSLESTTPYLLRQFHRVAQMWQRVGSDSRHNDAWSSLAQKLSVISPIPVRSSIVHGDYRLANLVVHHGAVSAVLDWELATVGDPLLDLAWLLDDWRQPDDDAIAMPSPTRAGGFGSRDQLIERYAVLVGEDPTTGGRIDYYRAFTQWRAATLLQGVIARARTESVPAHGRVAEHRLDETVSSLLSTSRMHLGRVLA